MAQTFRDIIAEFSMTSHSAAYYDLMKECNELILMEQCLVNQKFLMEKSVPSGINISESFFMEAVNESTIQAIMEETETKKKNIFKKIFDAILKLFQHMKAFFKRIATSIEETNQRRNEVFDSLKKLGLIELTKEDVESLLNDLTSDKNFKYGTIHKNQPYTKHLSLKYTEGENAPDPTDVKKLEKLLAFGTSPSTVKVMAKPTDSNRQAYPLKLDDIRSALKDLNWAFNETPKLNGYQVQNSLKKFRDVVKFIDECRDEVRKNGLEVDSRVEYLNLFVTNLDDCQKQIENMRLQYDHMIDAVKNIGQGQAVAEGDRKLEKDLGYMGDGYKILGEIYAKLSESAATTMTVYNDMIGFRKKVALVVTGFVGKNQSRVILPKSEEKS